MLYLGTPLWANQKWKNNLYPQDAGTNQFLLHYSQVFNSVEGNTTFYATPTESTIQRWFNDTDESFRFTLKIPQTISHQSSADAVGELQQWLTLVSALKHKLALVHLQLPARFSPSSLPQLAAMLHIITPEQRCAVEVRHPAFFDKAEHEIQLHRLLQQYQAERVVFDSRALFSVAATDEALQHAQQKKPRLPVHAISFTDTPMMRFIGVNDMDINRRFYQPWLQKVQSWLDEGKSPFCFFHTPDNLLAPQLCRQFAEDLGYSHRCREIWPGEHLDQLTLL